MNQIIERLRPHRFALAVALVALLGTLLTWPISQRFPFALFIVGVMVAAWRGGLRPGLVTTGVSTIALILLYLLFPAVREAEPGEHFLVRVAMFIAIGVMAGYLSMKCREAVVAHDRFHDSIAGLGEALVFTDAFGKVTFANSIAQTMIGCDAVQAEGKAIGEMVTLLDEETRIPIEDPVTGTLQANAPAALPEGIVLVSAQRIETPIEGTSIPLRDADERLVGVALAFHSAIGRRQRESELRQREQRSRSALGEAPAAIFLLDARGQCLFSNQACQKLGGFTLDEGLGQGWTRCIHLEDRDRLLNDWTTALRSAQGIFTGEFRLNGSPQENRRLCLRARPITSDKGESMGHVATLEDVTELHDAKTAVAANALRAEHAEAAQHEKEQEAAAATQRQKKIEEALGQLRDELQRQLQVGAKSRQEAEEILHATEAAKRSAEQARDELASRLETSERARRQAEDTVHGSQLEFARLMDEHLAAKRQAERTLQQTRDEFARLLDIHTAAVREAEAAARHQHDSFDPAEMERHISAQREAERSLEAARTTHAQELDRLANDSLTEMAALEEKLAESRRAEASSHSEFARLHCELESLRAAMLDKDQQLTSATLVIDELKRANELRERAALAAPPSLPPVNTNGHHRTEAQTPVLSRRPLEAGDWLSFN